MHLSVKISTVILVISFHILEISVDLTKHVKPIAPPAESKKPLESSLTVTTLTQYSYYESGKSKIKVMIKLDKVETHPKDKIKVTFKERSLEVVVMDLKGKNYIFRVPKLQCQIKPAESTYGFKEGYVVVTLKKMKDDDNWWSLFKSKGVCEVDSD